MHCKILFAVSFSSWYVITGVFLGKYVDSSRPFLSFSLESIACTPTPLAKGGRWSCWTRLHVDQSLILCKNKGSKLEPGLSRRPAACVCTCAPVLPWQDPAEMPSAPVSAFGVSRESASSPTQTHFIIPIILLHLLKSTCQAILQKKGTRIKRTQEKKSASKRKQTWSAHK